MKSSERGKNDRFISAIRLRHAKANACLLGSLVVDSSEIRNTLSWQPPYTVDEGLQQTLRP